MGDEADDIVTSFNLSQEEMNSYETVKNKFESHFIAKRNAIFERAKFNVRVQNKGEPVENFTTDLHCLAKHCKSGALIDQLIRDRIVVRLKIEKLSDKLQLDPNLTLEEATAQARQSEEVKKQQRVIHKDQITGNQQHNIDNVERSNCGKNNRRKEQSNKLEGIKFTRCLGPRHSRQKCPASESLWNN